MIEQRGRTIYLLKAKAKANQSGRKRFKYDIKVPAHLEAKAAQIQHKPDTEMQHQGKKTIQPTVIQKFGPS